MQIKEAIERLKLSKSTFLFGAEQTIVNIEDLDKVLNYIDIIHKELDRLEGIEDNTAMLKKELEESKKETQGIYDDYQDLGKEYYKLQCELEEQIESNKELNKVLIHFKAIIDEMAKYINNKDNGDIFDLVCTRECENDKCRLSNGDNEYQELECIKEYFSKKAEDNK